jgi:hypothetical protein
MGWFAKILLLVGLPAFLALLLTKLSFDRFTYLHLSVAEAVGGTLIPLGIATLWNGVTARAEKRKLGPDAKPGISLGAVCCAWLLTAISCWGMYTSHSVESKPVATFQDYRGPGCDLAVTFPGIPTLKPIVLPATATGMSGEQAELLTTDSYLRMECVRYPEDVNFTMEQAEFYLQNYIAQQGMNDVQYLPQDQGKGVAVGARGNKEIAGAGLTTYEATMIFGPGAMVALITASNAKIYPTAAVTAFRTSVKPAAP